MVSQKVALVTGSGRRRVGRVIAHLLAEHGYNIVIHYHTAAGEAAAAVAEMKAYGGESIAVPADLGNEREAAALVQAALDRFGRLDVLVNCASVYQAKRLEDVTAEDVRWNFNANILGTFLCCRHGGLAMVQQPEGGCIVNFGDWAEAKPYLDYAAYFASKGGVPVLTRCFAVELGTRNPRVRVNCILPGPVLFPEDLSEQEKQQSVRSTLVQRPGTPTDVAQAVLFFVQSSFVTGTTLAVDGGRTVFAGGS
jgi:pteridine reductase